MRAKGDVLRDVEAGTKYLIQYLDLQLEFELYPGPATRGGVGGADNRMVWRRSK